MRRLAALCLLFACTSSSTPSVCNGHAELCSRAYTSVAFPGTHDAYASAAYGVVDADQTTTLAQQLTDGVRVLHLEIIPNNNEPWLCHGICGLGGLSLVDGLTEVKSFVDGAPGEVVTLLTESTQITTDDIAAVFEQVDLQKYTRSHTLGQPWPTLGAMLGAGERVVVFHADNSSTGGTTFSWMLDRFSFTWETPWDNESSTDFGRCNADRGTKGNPLYVVDNYLENLVIENSVNAALTNDNPFLVDRVLYCQETEMTLPNFVMVNYYEVGDVFHDVDVLNGLAPTPDAGLSGFPPASFDAGAD